MAKLYFRYGAMNSGKTTALMQVAYNYKERGMRVLILKPAVDTKGQDSIVSRLGISCKVDKLITPEMDVVELVKQDSAEHGAPACVLCDESSSLRRNRLSSCSWSRWILASRSSATACVLTL